MQLTGSSNRPHEAGQFPGHGYDGEPGVFPLGRQLPVFPAQPKLRPPCDLQNIRRLSFSAFSKRDPRSRRRVPIMPGSLHQNPADMGVAGFRDASPAFPSAAGVLGRNQAGKGHQFMGPGEPGEVHQFRHQRHGGHRVHAAKGTKPGHCGSDLGTAGFFLDLHIEALDPFQLLFQSHQILGEDSLRIVVRKFLGADPIPVDLRPRLALVASSVAQQKFLEPVASPERILFSVLPGAHQVPQGFLGRRGNADRREFPHPVKPCQLLCVAAVRFHPVPGLLRDQGGRYHVAGNLLGSKEAPKFVAAGARFVGAPNIAHFPKPLDQPVDPRVRVRDLEAGGGSVRIVAHGGDDDAFLVDVHPNPGDTIVHDRLLPYVALAGLRPANPRYTRWGRSLHNVYRLKLTAPATFLRRPAA